MTEHVGSGIIGPALEPIGPPRDYGSRTLVETIARPMARFVERGPDFTLPSMWHREAACRDVDYEFVRDRGSTPNAIREICRACPVRQPCLDEALAHEALEYRIYGIRGGLSALERMILLGRRSDRRRKSAA